MEAKRLDMEGLLNASRQYRINTADKEDSVAWNLEEDITTSHRLALHHIAAQDAEINAKIGIKKETFELVLQWFEDEFEDGCNCTEEDIATGVHNKFCIEGLEVLEELRKAKENSPEGVAR